MVVVLVVVMLVGVFLLWQISKTQKTRAHIESAQLATQIGENVAKHVLSEYEQAKKNRRLNEFYKTLIDELAISDRELVQQVEAKPEAAHDLEREARDRGIECVLLKLRLPFSWSNGFGEPPSFPGPEPHANVEPMCPGPCDGWREDVLEVPPEVVASKTCPFCGTLLDFFERDLQPDLTAQFQREWRSEMQKWERFKLCFPLTAAEREAEDKQARDAEEADWLASTRAAIAAAKTKGIG